MGRQKTISDDDILAVARDVFRERGHSATTRDIAEQAGISEAILYQRFGTKDDLFFASMRPSGPDVEAILGPADPPGDGRAYLRTTVSRISKYLGEIIPLALRVTTHPSFDPAVYARAQPMPSALLRDGLAVRIGALAERGLIAAPAPALVARLLVSLAHDWALGQVVRHMAVHRDQELKEMVDVVWQGLRK
jgi:AcrR family transcriptional regulator